MVWRQMISFVLLFFSSWVLGQNNNLQFIQKKRTIDSVVASIDGNKNLLTNRIVGSDSLFGDFHGIYYYSVSVKKPDKIEYIFDSANEGQKTFYYADSLIKIVDNGSPLYFIDRLLPKDDGSATDGIKAGRLLGFEATFRKTFVLLFSNE